MPGNRCCLPAIAETERDAATASDLDLVMGEAVCNWVG
jgi:hypothetical protein